MLTDVMNERSVFVFWEKEIKTLRSFEMSVALPADTVCIPENFFNTYVSYKISHLLAAPWQEQDLC